MRIVTDTKLVARNNTISKYASTAGLCLLLGALAINFYAISQPQNPDLVTITLVVFLAGFVINNYGLTLKNRWGHESEKRLENSLKGLDDRYTLYNYRLGAAHVLSGPHGISVLLPKYQPGEITYSDGKWKAPGSRRGLFGMFSPDPLGDPVGEAAMEVESFNKFIKKRAPGFSFAPQAMIVFMHSKSEVSAKEAPLPTLHFKQLKEYVRRLPKDTAAPSPQTLTSLESQLGITEIRTEAGSE